MSEIDLQVVRESFPALKQPQVFFDNAGGSQILGDVADSIKDYLYTNNVQLGATYQIGKKSTNAYSAGMKAAAEFINASPDEVVIGPSTTQLFRNLAVSLLPSFAKTPDAEIVISTVDHEANIASWLFLANTLNLTVKFWSPSTTSNSDSTTTTTSNPNVHPTPTNPHLTPSSLLRLLTPRTRLVTCTHASNILGTITDIRSLADLIHTTVPGALLCVDGVALAPHRRVDMASLGADFYAFSWYKVYGPHVAQLYASRAAQDAAMGSLGHYFKGGWSLEDKLGLAGASYELVQAVPRVVAYVNRIGWEGIVAQEVVLQEVLLKYLRGTPEVFTIWGEDRADAAVRVPVVSFTVKGRESREVVEKVEGRSTFGFRWGHFYSLRLLENVLGLEGDKGVVRVSMLHYNTVEEVEGFVKALDEEVFGA